MTKETTVDVILHPVRMRIIQFLINQQLSAQQLKEMLPDIPQASLYRNIKKLVEAEVIHIVDEIPVRGTVEKVYSIQDPKAGVIGPEEINNLPKDGKMGLFIKYMANLMGEFERYVNQENVDFLADGVSFRQGSIYLSDEEFTEYIKELSTVYARFFHNQPDENRRRRTVATIIIPEPKDTSR
jgi:DNA-binding transcriptional ArsR family regulator